MIMMPIMMMMMMVVTMVTLNYQSLVSGSKD